MGDQPSLCVDDVGVAALADLDLRDHVPDELEIDFRDAHTRVAPRAGDGQRHVWLGFAAEIDRPVIDLARHRFRELGIIGEDGTTGHHGPAPTVDSPPLYAMCVELDDT